tara:strand:+ start:385 stop:651 length:267 start_codon:yes stop_codon:yes gene_type:complete
MLLLPNFQIAFWKKTLFCVLYSVQLNKEKLMKKCCKKKECNTTLKTEVSCKATAALSEEIKEDLRKTDGSLKELVENDNRNQQECEDK